MKGRNNFTTQESTDLIDLVGAKMLSAGDRQKELNQTICNKYNFRCEDFGLNKNFTASQLVDLVRDGRIIISRSIS